MRNIKIFCILIIIICTLNSCAFGGAEKLYDDSDAKADKRMQQMIEVIKNKDKENLKAMFSKQAQNEANNLDGEIDSLFGFIHGNINSWEREDNAYTHGWYDHGDTKKEVVSFYYVYTDKQKYFFVLDYYPDDTAHPDNIGLYMLAVTKAEDRLSYFNNQPDNSYAGIYIWEPTAAQKATATASST